MLIPKPSTSQERAWDTPPPTVGLYQSTDFIPYNWKQIPENHGYLEESEQIGV